MSIPGGDWDINCEIGARFHDKLYQHSTRIESIKLKLFRTIYELHKSLQKYFYDSRHESWLLIVDRTSMLFSLSDRHQKYYKISSKTSDLYFLHNFW